VSLQNLTLLEIHKLTAFNFYQIFNDRSNLQVLQPSPYMNKILCTTFLPTRVRQVTILPPQLHHNDTIVNAEYNKADLFLFHFDYLPDKCLVI